MQVYRGLETLTAQPERKTQLVAIWELDHEASVVEYQALAHRAIDERSGAGRTPVVVGGTGLYLRAAISDLAPPPPGDRERWERLYERLGPERAHAMLAEGDPLAAERVHANDRRRVVRALELAEMGESLHPSRDTLWSGETATRRSSSASRCRAKSSSGESSSARRRCSTQAWRRGTTRARRGVSYTARHALGLEEIAGCRGARRSPR